MADPPAATPASSGEAVGRRCDVAVIGAGIAGLTAAALLARAGLEVELLEAHHQSGGCAGTFRRGAWIFDVGATQVAGLEPGGIHQRLFAHLGVPAPAADPLDPGCVVDLADGRPPVRIGRDPQQWQEERSRQFPGSERFWSLCSALHQINWRFAERLPVLPPRSWWDLGQLLGGLEPATLASGLFTTASVADLLRLCGCAGDRRLRRFLDLQLRLYSQESADRTAALYGATVLQMVQQPLGLWHLHGSMQSLSAALEQALARAGGRLRLRHRVLALEPPRPGSGWRVMAQGPGGASLKLEAGDVVVSLPPQSLPSLLGEALPVAYGRRLQTLPEPSGALVFYGVVHRMRLPADCPGHLQLDGSDPGSLFVSVSQEGDGRAPAGEATVIASVFTPARDWFGGEEADYQRRKRQARLAIEAGLERLLGLAPEHWLHRELATPRGWAGWTGRPWGYVGGLGQHPLRFGPFGLASRTPLPHLWLCGDAIHPGEGTAGVSQSALMAVRQLLHSRGLPLPLEP
ncbi:MAG: C-3',4' desaturase CrtD [Cyanobium sp.]